MSRRQTCPPSPSDLSWVGIRALWSPSFVSNATLPYISQRSSSSFCWVCSFLFLRSTSNSPRPCRCRPPLPCLVLVSRCLLQNLSSICQDLFFLFFCDVILQRTSVHQIQSFLTSRTNAPFSFPEVASSIVLLDNYSPCNTAVGYFATDQKTHPLADVLFHSNLPIWDTRKKDTDLLATTRRETRDGSKHTTHSSRRVREGPSTTETPRSHSLEAGPEHSFASPLPYFSRRRHRIPSSGTPPSRFGFQQRGTSASLASLPSARLSTPRLCERLPRLPSLTFRISQWWPQSR